MESSLHPASSTKDEVQHDHDRTVVVQGFIAQHAAVIVHTVHRLAQDEARAATCLEAEETGARVVGQAAT